MIGASATARRPLTHLGRMGVLGMNRRNIELIAEYNPRKLLPHVDDKILTKELVAGQGIKVAEVLAIIEHHGDFKAFKRIAEEAGELVIKPARGSQGGGIFVASGGGPAGLRKPSGRLSGWDEIRFHVANILAGMYSLGGGGDRVLVEERLEPHSSFDSISFSGVPDLRMIVFRGVPVMAMLRLPTAESDGAANLHKGGVGAGITMETGTTNHAVQWDRSITQHPDFLTELTGFKVPDWEEALLLSARLGDVVDIGYLGVDLVVDEKRGPVLLELNARPGMAIQIANSSGLHAPLAIIEAMDSIPEDPAARVRLALDIERQTRLR